MKTIADIAVLVEAHAAQGMRELAAAFNTDGMTGHKDPAINAGTWASYQRVLAAGALCVRDRKVKRGWSSRRHRAQPRETGGRSAGQT